MVGLVLYPTRNCNTCTAEQKVMWGCDKDTTTPLFINEVEYKRCPLRLLLDEPEWTQRVLFFYRFYKDHEYPDAGTFYDQSARYLILMEIVGDAFRIANEAKNKNG